MHQAEIKQKACEIHDLSLDYHLTHAIFACNKFNEDYLKKNGQDKVNSLKAEIENAMREKDFSKVTALMEQKNTLELVRCRVFVDYIKMDDPDGGRVVKAGDNLIISLPETLRDSTMDQTGRFVKDAVHNLRKIMAHEIGHIVLHFRELIKTDGLQGSRELSSDLEEEAALFAAKLLELRDARNKKYLKEVYN